MTTTKLIGKGQVRTGRTELDVPHLGRTLTFVIPLLGPGSHKNVMGKIDKQKLLRPTTAQMFSLIDLVSQNPDNEYCSSILDRFTSNYFWTSTESLSTKQEYFVYDNIDGKMPNNGNDLMSLVNEKDPRVRLVEPESEVKLGYIPLKDFLKHPILLAHVGEEMIPTVERVAKRFDRFRGGIFANDYIRYDVKTVTAIDAIGSEITSLSNCDSKEDQGGCSLGIVDKSNSSYS